MIVDPLITPLEAKLGPEFDGDGTTRDHFGVSVALADNTALIGAHKDDTVTGPDAGSAYVFLRTGAEWSLQAKLAAGDQAAGDLFGLAVALSGDTALVGAPADDTALGLNGGSACVYVRSGAEWSREARLTARDAASGDRFGHSVAISDDIALVGAPLAHPSPMQGSMGSAYVFTRSGSLWSQEAKLTVNDAAVGDQFGHAVAISSNLALVGAPQRDAAAVTNSGSAYVFARAGTGWSQQAKLEGSDRGERSFFGISVAVSGGTALVGSPGDRATAGYTAGRGYVFVRAGTAWSQHAKLEAGDAAADDSLGNSVAVSGDMALLGAPKDNT